MLDSAALSLPEPTLSDTTLADRALIRFAKDRHFGTSALHALLRARESLTVAFGLLLAEVRNTGDPGSHLLARVKELEASLTRERDENTLLRERLMRIEPRHRPHYTPRHRFRILQFMKAHVLSAAEAARLFLISANTLSRWLHEASRHPGRETVGSLLEPVPPVRRYADVVRHLVQEMDGMGFGGKHLIAQTLARAAWRLSPRTVGRVRKERPVAPPQPPLHTERRTVTARSPNDVWMMDLTEVPGLFRLFSFKLAVVLDVFSRMPLAARVFPGEPTGEALAQLVAQAAHRHGEPRHFVSDQGAQFTSEAFRSCLKRLGIRQRFGAIGRTGSIAVIERFWKSLKGSLGLRSRPLLQQDLERRLHLGLLHYAYLRPHQALGGAAPAEAYFDVRPEHLSAVPPPRGRKGDRPDAPAFEVAHLDAERRLPILLPRAA